MKSSRRAAHAAAALLFAIGALLPGSLAGAQAGGDARLDALARAYYAEFWRQNPGRATSTGIHDYDAQLGDFSAAGFAARGAVANKYLAELAAIPPATLSPGGADDARILRARLESRLDGLTVDPDWRHDPGYYTGTAADAVYDVLSRKYAPAADRLRFAIAREQAIPAMLRAARANITTVNPVAAQLAQADIAGAVAFFKTTVPAAFASVADPALQAAFTAANAGAVAALEAYLADMKAGPFAHPSGSYAIGAARYARLLELQELTPIPLAEYERVGVAALAQTKAQFIATAAQIDPAKSPAEVAKGLGADHPAADKLLATAQDDLNELRRFVIAHRLLTLPPDNNVKVMETPEYARQTSFASMDSPGPLEQVATEAYYYVTPVEPDWPAERKEQHLSFFNNAYRPIVSAHEVMPGHYVNFAISRREKLSFIRRLSGSPSFSEGWAHYSEQMMVDEGWGNGDPRVRLAQLQGALQREARYLVGLREHTQGMTVAEATQFFKDNAFLADAPARREALRGTADPLYGYYTLGKLELLKLRRDYQAKMGPAFSLQKFHDAFLANGDPPIAITRRELLGAADDGKLL